MSTPCTTHEDPIQGALSELLSGMSALNMHPEPIPGSSGYLSETDAWAKHAMQHMHAAFELLQRTQQERDALKHKLWRAESKLTKQASGHPPAAPAVDGSPGTTTVFEVP